MTKLELPPFLVTQAVETALAEDLGQASDITTDSIITPEATAEAEIVSRKPGVIAGQDLVAASFKALDPDAEFVADVTDGSKVNGPAGLRAALLKHQDVFLLSFTENMLTYALGRRVDYADMPMVRAIVRDATKQNYKMSAFVQGIANSPAFRMAAPEVPAARTTEVERAVR